MNGKMNIKHSAKKTALLVFAILLASTAYVANAWESNLDDSCLFSTNYAGNSVSVIKTNTDEVVGTFSTGRGPVGITTARNGNTYVTNYSDNTVSVVPFGSDTASKTIPVGQGPTGIALNPNETLVFVANSRGDSVSVINTKSLTVVNTIDEVPGPFSCAFNPQGTVLIVTNPSRNTRTIIDPEVLNVIGQVPVGGNGPTRQAVSPQGNLNYIVTERSGGVWVGEIDFPYGGEYAPFPTNTPSAVAISADATRLYVADKGNSTLSAVETSNYQVVATAPIGAGPADAVVDPGTGKVYVSLYDDNYVQVFDGYLNQLGEIPVGERPTSLALAPNFASDQIIGISTDLTYIPRLGDTIGFNFNALGQTAAPKYFQTWYKSGYGTPAHDTNQWNIIQAFTPDSGVTWHPEASSNHIVLGWSVPFPNNVPADVMLAGMNVNVGGASDGIQFTDFTFSGSGFTKVGDWMTFTVNAIGPSPIYYKFFDRNGYGTPAYDANSWVVLQEFSTNNSATFTLTEPGNHVVVAWGVGDPNNIPADPAILGLGARINYDF